jgi:hypothetical protein
LFAGVAVLSFLLTGGTLAQASAQGFENGALALLVLGGVRAARRRLGGGNG